MWRNKVMQRRFRKMKCVKQINAQPVITLETVLGVVRAMSARKQGIAMVSNTEFKMLQQMQRGE